MLIHGEGQVTKPSCCRMDMCNPLNNPGRVKIESMQLFMKKIIETTEDQPNNESGKSHSRPFVSMVVPAYNEAALLEESLNKICHYMESI